MAAGQGFKTFTTGEVLTAGDVNGYLMQGINVFADATARDAAITAPAEGQFAYTKDNNSLWYYTGSAWAASGATGDIEGVTVTSPLTGGGTSGTVTVGIQDASTAQKGSVQLSDSTASTSTTLAATANAVKTTYDLANGAIPKSTVTTAGDIIYATGASTVTRRAIGTTGQVLTVSGGLPTWASSSSGSLTLISTTTLTGSSQVNLTSIPSTYKALKLFIAGAYPDATQYLRFLFNNDTTNPAYGVTSVPNARTSAFSFSGSGTPYADTFYCWAGGGTENNIVLDIENYAQSGVYKYAEVRGLTRRANTQTYDFGICPIFYFGTGAISQLNILFSGQVFSNGTAYLYGVN